MEVASLTAGAVHVAAMVLGAAANALALLAFRRRRRRRGALSDRFVVNLLSGALVTALTLPPLALAELVGAGGVGAAGCEGEDEDEAPGSGAGSWGLCAAGEAAAAFAASLPPLAVLLLAGDQALAVLQPLRYRARLDTPRAAGLMLVGWSLALTFGAASALVPPGPASLWRSCRPLTPGDPSDPGGGGAAPRVALAATGFALLFALPFVITALIYARISGAARRNSQQAAAAGPAHIHASNVISNTPEQQTLRPRAAIVTSIRSRLSNASALGRRPESRAARVSALVVLLALGCWLPWHAVALWRALAATSGSSIERSRWVDAGSLALLSAASPLTPALFAFRSRRVRRELRRLLRLHPLSTSSPSTHARIQPGPSPQPPNVCRPLLASPSPSPPPPRSPSLTSPPPTPSTTTTMLLPPALLPPVVAAADASGTARGSFSSAGSTQATTSTDE